MTESFSVEVVGWSQDGRIPSTFAFGRLDDGEFALSENRNPTIRWASPPVGTKSFAILCTDPDVPSVGDDVNQEGKTVPADLPRVDFFHWVVADIPVSVSEIVEGAASDGVTPRGKSTGPKDYGVEGSNSYTGWFAGDADMEGTYGGYDGPCPPWNDSIVHHYHFTVFALDVESLGLEGDFEGPDLRKAMEGHILASAEYVGTYSLNPRV